MPFLADPFTVRTGFGSGVTHLSTTGAPPPARADGSVADDAKHSRRNFPVIPGDANRPDNEAVPEHDPDGTPWAA